MKKIIFTFFAIALSMGVFAHQQNDTMFIHKEQTITAIPTQYIDSVVPQMGANATQDSLHIFRNNTVTARFSVQDIDSITFYRAEIVLLPTPDAPTPDAVIWSETLTLADISLPNGWTWVVPTTALGVGENQPFYANFELLGYMPATNIEILVTVEPVYVPGVSVESVSFNQTMASLFLGNTTRLAATVLPEDATNKTLIWSSSDLAVATVNAETGLITSVSAGTVNIVVRTEDGNFTDTIVVNVGLFGCSPTHGAWIHDLGEIARGSKETVIEGYGIRQIWSGAVTATNCYNRAFNGGASSGPFNASCRSNISGVREHGDQFSWCAVMRFAEELCPYPWRVPTRQDFIDLNTALGGVFGFLPVGDYSFITDNYINRWGGVLWADNNRWAHYWSQSMSTTSSFAAYETRFGGSGGQWDSPIVNRYRLVNRSVGVVLRCVR